MEDAARDRAAPDGRAELDVVVVGAGFSGLYLLHRLRQLGLRTRCFDLADDVGGTWYWNRYPGARCDIPTTDYAYSFDPALEREWTWTEKYATQPEILAYLRYVADRFDLRSDITFSTGVTSASWDDARSRWRIVTTQGEQLDTRYYVMASGCLSMPKAPEIEGVERFAGEVYSTARWPHEPVDLTGKRVGVIGTGSSGVQSIPLLAQQAASLTVFQRTPNFSVPAHNGPAPADRLARLHEDRDAYREAARRSRGGIPVPLPDVAGVTATEAVRRERFEAAWEAGELFAILGVFSDELINPASNEIVAELCREKIRSIVHDPSTAARLCPTDHPFGTKRPCLDTGYYATYNLPHVRLVDLREHPIRSITPSGIETDDEHHDLDVIVLATGFDAMTGAIVAVDIAGRGGVTLREKWSDGPSTYLGLMTAGFPNLFVVTGPGSPSVLSNMLVSIEQHVEFVADCLAYLGDHGYETIEPTETAEAGWNRHVEDCAEITLYPRAASWYMGANVPGKARVFLPYVGGVDAYRAACEEVVARGYLGFSMHGPDGAQCNDGVIRRLQPDVAIMLDLFATMGLPTIDSLEPADARALMDALGAASPPGPEVAETLDGTLPGPAGPLAYRCFRPAGAGPHPVVCYFHGGGFVLGSEGSDAPLCRDLCVRAGVVVVSVDYRHAPEARFPAAHDDAYAAMCWVAEHAAALGGAPGPIALAGWSAGANLAAACCQRARDEGGPEIAGQLLLCPVTDASTRRPSYVENGEGYLLTASLMGWFLDHYVDEADRADPRISPLLGSLAGLPPTTVVTAEFDPLRDEGVAYAEALDAAGTPVRLLTARGHVHTSVTAVDAVISGAPVRAQMADALRVLFGAVARVGS